MDRVYKETAVILKKLEGKHGSLQSLVFTSKNACSVKKKLFALASQTMKYKSPILEAMKECSLPGNAPKIGRHLCMILVYDLVFGKGIQCGGPLKRFMMENKEKLKSALSNQDRVNSECSRPVVLPKYARVNLLKVSVEKVIDLLKDINYNIVSREDFLEHFKSCSLPKQLAQTKKLSHADECCSHNIFCKDSLLDDVLMFCPSSSLTSTQLYATSHLILQDKASCLPAYLLAPPPGGVVIDACAAPGNKTTHLASLLSNSGTIYSFDKDRRRYSTLVKMVEKSGSTCVKPQCQDFLKENEHVIEDALSCFEDDFELIDCLQDWDRRGETSFAVGSCCIRMCSDDLTNGFFVAVFNRKLNTSVKTKSQTFEQKKQLESPIPKQICASVRKRKKNKKGKHPVTKK
ncbi:28S rRNA (cytosine-C(5))-methyltransferase-like isoform X2 [Halichondria panicea]|uniref:28S rRNA (cytosine-C(5))-methyltransferase-like isoform X2 n=1 Tax=Halichondria panicea TaxID=6063 RepID=UPI00312B70EE